MNNIFNRLSIKERASFAKRLAFLVKAGVPILEGLKILRKQSLSSKIKIKMLDRVIEDVSNGQFLSSSFSKLHQIFDQFAINIIRVGEESGTLDSNLNYLAEELSKKQILRKKILGAMIYPFFIVIATFGVAMMLILYIFPKILPIFKSLNVTLPFTTRMLIFSSDFLSHYWMSIFGFIILLIASAVLLLRKPFIKFRVEEIIFGIPLLGNLSRNYQLANFCRTLGLLLKSDIKIVRAFSILADTTSNLVYKNEFHSLSKSIARGARITDYMENSPKLFPAMLSQMIAIGETTGNLDEMLLYLSELYETEVDEVTKNLSTVIEPVLMIFMGIVVGFIAISIISPIYQVTQNIHP